MDRARGPDWKLQLGPRQFRLVVKVYRWNRRLLGNLVVYATRCVETRIVNGMLALASCNDHHHLHFAIWVQGLPGYALVIQHSRLIEQVFVFVVVSFCVPACASSLPSNSLDGLGRQPTWLNLGAGLFDVLLSMFIAVVFVMFYVGLFVAFRLIFAVSYKS